MRILYATTIGMTMGFFKQIIKQLIDDGNTVDIACNDEAWKVDDFYRDLGCNIYQIDWTRSPLSKGNIKAVKELRKILSSKQYDIVHCHTPIAGICTRLACNSFRKKGLKVIYTAHGFHFYKGAPLKNWLIYYPIEKFCSHFTDCMITINREDYELAKRKMKAKRIEYVPGVGIDVGKFKNTIVDRDKKRAELGIPADAVLLLSVGELNKNKNHEAVIRALEELKNTDIHYMIAGAGDLSEYLNNLAKSLNIEKQVHLLGYRNDVAELYKVSDLYILPSFREGLNVSLIEAKSSGLKAICSKIRGNTDIVDLNNCFMPDEYKNISKMIGDIIRKNNYLLETDDTDVGRYDACHIINEINNLYLNCSAQ